MITLVMGAKDHVSTYTAIMALFGTASALVIWWS
jgi:hypothetical protein